MVTLGVYLLKGKLGSKEIFYFSGITPGADNITVAQVSPIQFVSEMERV